MCQRLFASLSQAELSLFSAISPVTSFGHELVESVIDSKTKKITTNKRKGNDERTYRAKKGPREKSLDFFYKVGSVSAFVS